MDGIEPRGFIVLSDHIATCFYMYTGRVVQLAVRSLRSMQSAYCFFSCSSMNFLLGCQLEYFRADIEITHLMKSASSLLEALIGGVALAAVFEGPDMA